MKTIIAITILILSTFSFLQSEEAKTYKVDIDSKGMKTFYNKNDPADPDFKIELNRICVISRDYLDSLEVGKFMIYDFDFDKDGNIIILDLDRMWKFSRNGRFIKKWSRAGEGPGEFRQPNSFYILNDTIYVQNFPKIIKFDSTGRFINNILITNYSDFPRKVFAVGRSYLLGVTGSGFDPDSFKKTDRIKMFDTKNLRMIKSLFVREKKKKGTMFSRDDYFLYTGGEKEFFVVDNSYDDYKIDCFDSKTGKMKYKIRKNHIRVKNDEKIKTHHGVYNGEKIVITTGDEKLKESINWVYYDKYGRLWVDSNNIDKKEKEESGLYFDIFKDGVFLKRIKLDLGIIKPWGFKLNGNKIVVFDEDNNVNIYEFK
ncbi:TPA: hypothetical protein DCR49_07705 [Candidatus Delongbacteria bacterium]|nr:hypothetical protein [Candidatus Delongbacteria bacterium]